MPVQLRLAFSSVIDWMEKRINTDGVANSARLWCTHRDKSADQGDKSLRKFANSWRNCREIIQTTPQQAIFVCVDVSSSSLCSSLGSLSGYGHRQLQEAINFRQITAWISVKIRLKGVPPSRAPGAREGDGRPRAWGVNSKCGETVLTPFSAEGGTLREGRRRGD